MIDIYEGAMAAKKAKKLKSQATRKREGKALRSQRVELGWSIEDLATLLGYTREHWSKFENGHREIPPVVTLAMRAVTPCEGGEE